MAFALMGVFRPAWGDECQAIGIDGTDQVDLSNSSAGLTIRAFPANSGALVKFFVGANSFDGDAPNYSNYRGEDHSAPFDITVSVSAVGQEFTAASYHGNKLLGTCTRTITAKNEEENNGENNELPKGSRPEFVNPVDREPKYNGIRIGVPVVNGNNRLTANAYCRHAHGENRIALGWELEPESFVSLNPWEWKVAYVDNYIGDGQFWGDGKWLHTHYHGQKDNSEHPDYYIYVFDRNNYGRFKYFKHIHCNLPTTRPISILRQSHSPAGSLIKPKFCLQVSKQDFDHKINGGNVEIAYCNGWANQKFVYDSADEQVKSANGMCLTADNSDQVSIQHCHSGNNQKWNWGNVAVADLKPRSFMNRCLTGESPSGDHLMPESNQPNSVVLGNCSSPVERHRWSLDRRAQPIIVAMGDSYASGEGTNDFISGTNESNVKWWDLVALLTDPHTVAGFFYDSLDALLGVRENMCHRSRFAYGMLLAEKWELTPRFFACSGALIKDVSFFDRRREEHTGQYKEGLQVFRLAGGTTYGREQVREPGVGIVTISIGGNDIGFVSALFTCMEFRDCHKFYHAKFEKGIKYVSDSPSEFGSYHGKYPHAHHLHGYMYKDVSLLTNVYLEIAKRAPNALIRVVDYPPIISDDGCNVEGLNANKAVREFLDADWLEIDHTESLYLVKLQDRLNKVVKEAVLEARGMLGDRIRLVETAKTMANHGLCSKDKWINGVLVDDYNTARNSIHPKKIAHEKGFLPALMSTFP